jgi:hypothetical protein
MRVNCSSFWSESDDLNWFCFNIWKFGIFDDDDDENHQALN